MKRPALTSLLAARTRLLANVGVMSLASAALVVVATSSDGYKATNVDLNDGAVWVTNREAGKVARLNIRIDELDFSLRDLGAPDVIQDGRHVYVGDGSGVSRIVVETGGFAPPANGIPLDDYQIGGGRAALLDRESGHLWTGFATAIVAPAYPDKPSGAVPAGSILAVTNTGRVLIVDPQGGEWFEVELDDDGQPARPLEEEASDGPTTSTTTPVGEAPDDAVLAIEPAESFVVDHDLPEGTGVSTVGDDLVFLTPDGDVFGATGPVARITGSVFAMQQPSGPAESALVASDRGLFSVDLATATVTELSDHEGRPAAPVRVGSCAYGAWAADVSTWSRTCPGRPPLADAVIAGATASDELAFRVNQNNIVINELAEGRLWAVHDGDLVRVGGWDDDQGAASDDVSPDADSDSEDEADRICVDDRLNGRPAANDDPALGVRPARQTLLDVLSNDSDPNCDPIFVDSASISLTDPSVGRLDVVDNGQHLLFTPADGADDGAFSFSYAVSDPSGERSEPATAVVQIVDNDTNRPPRLRSKADGSERTSRTVVESGKMMRYNVLADWWDPDGDDVTLLGASAPADRGQVSSTPDGIVTFGAFGLTSGVQVVSVRVTDGRGADGVASGQLEVAVQAQGQAIPPIAQDDFLTLMVGETAVVHPRSNDVDGNGSGPDNPLSVTPMLTELPGLDARYDATTDSLQVTGVAAGVHAIPYALTDGVDEAHATVLVTVWNAPASNVAPIAVPDRAVLRPERVANVDVLANDIDLDGDITAVMSVSSPEITDELGGVRASIVDRRLVQVELVSPSTGLLPVGPFTVTYQIDDGRGGLEGRTPVHGQLIVLVDSSNGDQPPLPAPDSLVVRTGDVGTVAVVANDSDPDGDRITLVGVQADEASELEAEGALVAWTNGQAVWVRGGTPGHHDLHYSVEANGKQASGTISIDVRAMPGDGTPNLPPARRDLDVRAARGSRIRIRVPVDGVDPDGDSVSLVGVDAPREVTNGTSVEVNPIDAGQLVYEVDPRSTVTSDEFEYTIADALGQSNKARVRVAIFDVEPSAPVAHDDIVRARPGRVLLLPVVANDVDADDDPLEIADPPFLDLEGQPTVQPQHPDEVAVVVDEPDGAPTGGRLEIKVPAVDAPALSERYRVSDGANTSSAAVRVIPDPTAPNMAPVTFGAVVTADDARGQPVVRVDVLKTDFDPDGNTPLVVGLPSLVAMPGVQAETDGSIVTITLTNDSQVVVYSVTDADPDAPATSYGVIRVPGLENHPPELNERGQNADRSNFRIPADSSEPLVFVLADVLTDAEDPPEGIRLTDTEVTAAGTGSIDVADDRASFEFRPNGGLVGYQAQVTFEVEDRPDDPATSQKKAHTIYFDVEPPGNTPPTVVTDGVVEVPQYDEPVTYDLAPLVVDEQGDPLTFEVESAPDGFDIGLEGSTLHIISTNDAVRVGDRFSIRFRVTDGDADYEPASGEVHVTVIRTGRGQPIAATIGPIEAVRGEPAPSQDVVGQSTNPFPDKPLTIESVTAGSGGAVACVSACGQSPIVFTPDQPGNFDVTYVVRDTLGQTSTGKITYVVKGRPLAPGVPQIGSVGDEVVNLTWAPADLQGGTLVHYVVTAVETGDTKTSTTTALAFDGLENARTYHFTVYAVNEVPGDGESSGQSNGAIPDRVPDPPQNLRFTDYGDGTLAMQWDPPSTAANYSAITGYEVNVAGYGVIPLDSPVTVLTQTGLQNGTDYTFTVRARNSAQTQGGWGAASPVSVSERPSRQPDQPVNVVTAAAGDGGTPRASVTWSAPSFDGGRPIVRYQVCSVQTPSLCQDADNSRQTTFTIAIGSDNSYVVRAINSDKNQPTSNPSGASNVVRGTVTPGIPTITDVASSNNTLTVSSNAGSNGGCSSTFIEYVIDGGTNWQTSNVFSGLANGTAYTVTARMTLGSGCGAYLGPTASPSSPPSPGVAQTPFGPLTQPVINGSVSGTSINYSWNANQGANGRPWTATVSGEGCSWSISAGQTQTGGCSTNPGYNSGSRTVTITVSAPGVPSQSASWTGATGDPPPPPTMTVVTPAGGTCPEPDFSSPSNWNGGLCNGDTRGTGYGFSRSQTIVVNCQIHLSGWVYSPWVRIQSGGPGAGWYLAYDTVTVTSGSLATLPNC